jgi:hypothetical protein
MFYYLVCVISTVCHGSGLGGIIVVFVPTRSENSMFYFLWCWYHVVCRYCGGCSWRALESWLVWPGCENRGSVWFPAATSLFLKPAEGVMMVAVGQLLCRWREDVVDFPLVPHHLSFVFVSVSSCVAAII